MITRIFQFATGTLFAAGLVVGAAVAEDKPKSINWDDLVPPSAMGSDTPVTVEKDSEAHPTIGDAPMPLSSSNQDATVAELDGKRVRIPAFLVPLDGNRNALTELLLVPYFGACIHVPPPPPNQIIHVQPEGDGVSIEGIDIYDAVWATGTIRTQAISHDIAEIGYRMEIEKLETYTE